MCVWLKRKSHFTRYYHHIWLFVLYIHFDFIFFITWLLDVCNWHATLKIPNAIFQKHVHYTYTLAHIVSVMDLIIWSISWVDLHYKRNEINPVWLKRPQAITSIWNCLDLFSPKILIMDVHYTEQMFSSQSRSHPLWYLYYIQNGLGYKNI